MRTIIPIIIAVEPWVVLQMTDTLLNQVLAFPPSVPLTSWTETWLGQVALEDIVFKSSESEDPDLWFVKPLTEEILRRKKTHGKASNTSLWNDDGNAPLWKYVIRMTKPAA